MAAGDNFRCSIMSLCVGNEVVNTFHVKQIGDSATPEQDIFDTWNTDVKSSYLAMLPADLALQTFTVLKEGGTQPGQVFGPTGSGALAVSWSDTTSAAILTLRTELRGRSGRGRQYIGPLVDSLAEKGAPTAVLTGLLTTYINALTGAFPILGPYELVVYSRKLSAGMPVVVITQQPILGTQRRRRLGVGA